MTNNRDVRREQVINLMVDFLQEKVYAGQEIDENDLRHTAVLYYDIIEEITKALDKVEREALAASKNKVDASNPNQVDLVGGPMAVRDNTFKG